MRTYQGLWEDLKLKGSVTLSLPPSYHDRVHKAVRKEALADRQFRVKVDSLGAKFYISKTYLGSQLTLKLTWTSINKDAESWLQAMRQSSLS